MLTAKDGQWWASCAAVYTGLLYRNPPVPAAVFAALLTLAEQADDNACRADAMLLGLTDPMLAALITTERDRKPVELTADDPDLSGCTATVRP